MDRTTELALIDEIGRLLAERTTAMAPEPVAIPFEDIVGSERARAERDLLFRRHPMVIAPSAVIPEAGDFATQDVGGLPLLLTRAKDGVARVFLNVCRHRGNRLCHEQTGNRVAFACNYHAWSYSNEGLCRSMVDRDGFAGLDREDFGLISYPAEERHGLIWMLPSHTGQLDVANYLGSELDAELGGYLPHTKHVHQSTTRIFPFNWKLGVNTFQELFHLAYLHRKTLGRAFISNVSAFRSYAPHQRLTVVRSTFPEMLTLPEEERNLFPNCTLVYMLFPNTILTWQLDHVELWRFSPSPDDPQQCEVGLWLLTEEGPMSDSARRHWDRSWEVVCDTVFGEDFATMADIQRSLLSGELPELVYGRNEIGLQDYHRQLAEALSGAAA